MWGGGGETECSRCSEGVFEEGLVEDISNGTQWAYTGLRTSGRIGCVVPVIMLQIQNIFTKTLVKMLKQ